MRNRVGIVLFLALVSGLLAAYLAFRFLRQPATPETAVATPTQTVGVVVAAVNLGAGQVVEPQHVRVAQWPADFLPSGFSRSPDEVVGKALIENVRTNQPILAETIAGEGAGLQVKVPEGMRAVSVRVTDVVGVAGFISNGSHVDVLVTAQPENEGDRAITKVVLQDVLVLAVGQMLVQENPEQPVQVPVVTFAVEPEEAERLTMAQERGSIRLALRNISDRDTVETSGVRLTELFGERRVATPTGQRRFVPRQPAGVSVEVYKGSQSSTVRVDDGGGS